MRMLLLKSLLKSPLTERPPEVSDAAVEELAQALHRASRKKLGRSLSIRAIDAGSCNGCELEMNALSNAFYDIERFGIHFVASPRHADVLMITGPVTKNMCDAMQKTYDAAPHPKWVVAIGDCAQNGGCFAGSYAVMDGVSKVLPVDLHIPGCPPRPIEILRGMLSLLESASK
ncbi:NADH-quinone oxidoreductase subunit NuoB [Roseiarcaceae bacterium H3SJ34-1]|uniref:NADH-quinone oxidoreductase subunit B family protein n=1 Tax=Terripilifer ovatus TaxID=3032367 RepID=UPI003AB95356|nr:NADH-quinone oxidoreductase subunit NuoB [Roseiarcaceae bacterium H3SJ34-1]